MVEPLLTITDDANDVTKYATKPRIVLMVSKTKHRKAGNNPPFSGAPTKRVRTAGPAMVSNSSSKIAKQDSFGLPSFKLRHDRTEMARNGSAEKELSMQQEELEKDDIPSDAFVAIHSLMQSDEGLHIPLSNTASNRGTVSIQAVLEHQIIGKFLENHASSINNEILELIRTNMLRRLFCQEMSTTALILTGEYVRAAWDAYRQYDQQQAAYSSPARPPEAEKVLSWFLSNLHHWTGTTISRSMLLDRWQADGNGIQCVTSASLKSDTGFSREWHFQLSLEELLRMQVLIRDPRTTGTSMNENFHLWLPQWGVVLKAWNDGRKQLLHLLARGSFSGRSGLKGRTKMDASKKREISKGNLLKQNRNSHICTQFLLNELVYKGKIRIVERPSGSFVQLLKDDFAT
jgi:hypothetical protein